MAPVVKEVELIPGAEIDLGDIVLHGAAGRIIVELVGMREGHEYGVMLGDSQVAGTVSPLMHAENGRYTFKVPPRAYHVSATFRRGGRVVNTRVELSEDDPIQTIRIDVSELEPRPSPGG